MRHTLRDPESSSSESETGQHPYGKHKKKRHIRPKHPNKHHEGTSLLRLSKLTLLHVHWLTLNQVIESDGVKL